MEIVLKKKWDNPITAPYHNSGSMEEINFIGRDKEIELLKNDILQKDQGSILVAGHRGVGKTSFVYKVLHLVKKEQPKTVYIYINAGQLDNNGGGEAGQITTETILKTLIRRLYATATKGVFTNNKDTVRKEQAFPVYDPKNYERLEKLYKKAVAKDFKLQEVILNSNTVSIVKEKSSERKFSLVNLALAKLWPVISFASGLGMMIYQPAGADIWYKVISFIFTLPLALSYTFTSLISKRNESQNQVKAEELYEMDNNLGNLEYDLEEFHRLLYQSGINVIYVIDELDKLNDEQVKKVLRYLKNLFTLSKAIFIFIANEDLYSKASQELIGESYRPEYYTFFTSKYFIGRPTMEELKKYFFSRVDETIDTETIPIQRAAHYFSYESKGDYFNLVNTIKDSIIKYDDKNDPVVDIAVNNPVILKKSRLHKCISVIFYQMYFSTNFSRMRENELLHRQLIDYMYKLKEQNTPDICEDPENSERVSSAIRDINRLLSSLNFLKKNTEKSIRINGVDTIVSTYSYTGLFTNDPPDSMETFSENEKRFVALGDEFLKTFLPIVNAARVIDQQKKINSTELCDNLSIILAKGIQGIDLATSYSWPDIYFDLQLAVPVQQYSPETIETCAIELTDAILRIKASGNSIYKAQILRWFEKNGYVEPSSPRDFPAINSFRQTLRANKMEWTNFFFTLPKSDNPQWAFLFGWFTQNSISDVLGRLENKEEFDKSVILFAADTPAALRPVGVKHMYFVDLSTPEKLLESVEETTRAIQYQHKWRTEANNKKASV